MLLSRLDDVEEQDQKYRANDIAVNRHGGPPKPLGRAGGQPVLQQILGNQSHTKGYDDQHGDAVLSADIGVDHHGEGQTD